MSSTLRRTALALLVLAAVPPAAHAQPAPHHARVEAVPPAPMSTLQPVPSPIEVIEATPAATSPSVPAAPGMPWQAWLLISIAALTGAERILAGIRALLGIVAPHTKTATDDHALDVLGRLDDGMIELLGRLHVVASSVAPTAPLPVQTSPTKAPAMADDSDANPVRTANLSALLALVIAGTAMQTGCTAVQRTAAKRAIIDCTAPARAELVDATTPLAVTAIKLATNPDGSIDSTKLRAYFKPVHLLSEAGVIVSCAAIAAFRELRGSSAVMLLAGTGPGPTTEALAAAEIELRSPWGGATFQLAGTVR